MQEDRTPGFVPGVLFVAPFEWSGMYVGSARRAGGQIKQQKPRTRRGRINEKSDSGFAEHRSNLNLWIRRDVRNGTPGNFHVYATDAGCERQGRQMCLIDGPAQAVFLRWGDVQGDDVAAG
ncbi:hypothetical protein [Deinococcus malanensis]|uniref:hypothetical protein n=1 Tax=Deinococcus malanensis TaxID=1706855 RepID=UPI00166BEFA6|nr:hypothetical protein [Deinococcus malanensis]